MPTYYTIETTTKSKYIVNLNLFDKIENYINNLSINDENNDNLNIKYSREEKIYHLSSYSVDISNNLFLNSILNLIDLNYTPDGNSYNLLHLALDNYLECYFNEHENKNKNKNQFHVNIKKLKEDKDIINSVIRLETLNILLSHAKITNSYNNLDYYSRNLIEFIDKYDNWTLLDIFINEFNISLWSIYHYSIAWAYKKVFEKLVDKYEDKINFKWTLSAIEIAERFDHEEMREYVKNYLDLKKISYI